jgi:DNA-binding NarL/FixJ family response regulator
MDQPPRAALLGTDLMLSSRLRTALASGGAGLVEEARDDLLPPVPLVFVDLNQDADARIDAIARLRGRDGSATIVGFCNHDDRDLIRRAMAAGATQVIANRHLAEAAVRLLGIPAGRGGAA